MEAPTNMAAPATKRARTTMMAFVAPRTLEDVDAATSHMQERVALRESRGFSASASSISNGNVLFGANQAPRSGATAPASPCSVGDDDADQTFDMSVYGDVTNYTRLMEMEAAEAEQAIYGNREHDEGDSSADESSREVQQAPPIVAAPLEAPINDLTSARIKQKPPQPSRRVRYSVKHDCALLQEVLGGSGLFAATAESKADRWLKIEASMSKHGLNVKPGGLRKHLEQLTKNHISNTNADLSLSGIERAQTADEILRDKLVGEYVSKLADDKHAVARMKANSEQSKREKQNITDGEEVRAKALQPQGADMAWNAAKPAQRYKMNAVSSPWAMRVAATTTRSSSGFMLPMSD